MTGPTSRFLSRRAALLGSAMLALGSFGSGRTAGATPTRSDAQTDPIELWPAGAPGGDAVQVVEDVVERPHPQDLRDRIARGVRRPTLTAFLPEVPARAAVLVIPGGGYKHVAIDKEGLETAHWLAQRGFAAYVLRYRLPGDGWAAGADAPLQDAQRALRIVRARCAGLGIEPQRTVAIGFSAGGHLAARLATCFEQVTYEPRDALDAASPRPDAVALIYPVITLSGEGVHEGSRDFLLGRDASPARLQAWSAQNGVTRQAPPAFIVHAADDTSVPLRNSTLMFDALRAAGVPVDLHVFAHGGHGFGLRAIEGRPVAAWPALFADWCVRQPGFDAAPRT